MTHLPSYNEGDLGYRSAPDYLRQLLEQNPNDESVVPTEMIITRHIPRTRSASELTPRSNGKRWTSLRGHEPVAIL